MPSTQQLIDFVLHLDVHLNEWADFFGIWLYLILFIVVFCETGLVVTPFLPGDSLLFAVGALAGAATSNLSLPLLIVLLIAAAVAGDAVNYFLGYHAGPLVFSKESSWWRNKKNLVRTHNFYVRYGGKTIVIARFIPIIRTFAPFVAGIGRMGYRKFWVYNVMGGIGWVLVFLLGGYYFGQTEIVRRNFSLVIIAIIIISVLPAVFEVCLAWFRGHKSAPTGEGPQRGVENRANVTPALGQNGNGGGLPQDKPTNRPAAR
jgi:membrane-associated protein